jgi:hypothetical protein
VWERGGARILADDPAGRGGCQSRHQGSRAHAAARETGQLSATVAAIKVKGVLSGQRIERREVGTPGEFDSLSDDELERMLVERFRALCLTPDAGGDSRH